MEHTFSIKVILGSTRPNRFSEYPGKWMFDLLRKRTNVDVEMLDLRDYPMPFFNESITPSSKKEEYTHEAVVRWTKKIREADGFIFIAPEYNRGPSAVLKNALDYVHAEWQKKPVGFVAYGSVGGARSVEHLRLSTIELQMAPISKAVHIQSPWTLRDETGGAKPDAFKSYENNAEMLIDQLLWWGRALREARRKE